MRPLNQWEFFYLQASTINMKAVMDESNKLGALGWEPVGVTSADKTVGANSNIVIFKRPMAEGLVLDPAADLVEAGVRQLHQVERIQQV